MGFLNIKKKLLYIQTMGKNYQTKHYFLQALRDKGVDLLTEYKESVLKWSKNMAAKDIALVYGVPSQLIGIPDAQTYSKMGRHASDRAETRGIFFILKAPDELP